MQFTPKKESEINRFAPIPDGDYPFTVLESKEQASKSVKNAGRIMCALKIAVHAPNRDQWVFDYFADWFSEWKLKHFAETCGREADYEAGSLDVADNGAQGWTGTVRIITEVDQQTGKERNAVDDYVVADAKPQQPIKAATPKAKTPDKETDDCPF